MSDSLKPPVTFATVREIALSFPGVEEGRSQGNTPSLHVKKKHIGWLHHDGDTFVMRVDKLERDMLLQAAPEIYHITDHYLNSCYVLVRVSKIDRDDLHGHIERAWRQVAPKRVIAQFDSQK